MCKKQQLPVQLNKAYLVHSQGQQQKLNPSHISLFEFICILADDHMVNSSSSAAPSPWVCHPLPIRSEPFAS